MKLWFAPGSEVPLYRQLVTQVVLAILSGDLKPGEKLPSTRELARRFDIHANTVSAAYQQLEVEHWVQSRRGSGVYVKDGTPQPMTPEEVLEVHIAGFFRAVRELGLPAEIVRAQVARWLAAPPPDHLLLIEADEKLAQILVAEIKAITVMPVRVLAPEDCHADRGRLIGAVPLCRPSRKLVVQGAVGVLPINSATAWLAPLVSAALGHLIAVVSHWPEFLETARTILLAAGVCGDSLMLIAANSPGWLRGLEIASAILCDVYTASRPELPKKPRQFVFPLLATSAVGMVRAFEQTEMRVAVVTPKKAS